MLGRKAAIEKACPVTGVALGLEVEGDGPAAESGEVVYFTLPARRWWEDIGETCTILLFRLEEDVRAWCWEREQAVAGVLSLETARRLAVAWYQDRLDPGWRRKRGEEVRALFDELGMTGPFWASS